MYAWFFARAHFLPLANQCTYTVGRMILQIAPHINTLNVLRFLKGSWQYSVGSWFETVPIAIFRLVLIFLSFQLRYIPKRLFYIPGDLKKAKLCTLICVKKSFLIDLMKSALFTMFWKCCRMVFIKYLL